MKDFLTNMITMNFLLFFILQLSNVILSTMRSIITIKGKVHTAALFNAISYTFYATIVKLITSQDLLVVVLVTFLTNIIGVYIARFLINKGTKDKLWVYNATFKSKEVSVNKIIDILKVAEIQHVYTEIVKGSLYSFQIFAPTQNESRMIKEILNNYNIKYFIVESK